MNTQEMKKLHKKNPDKWIIVRGGNLFGWEKRNRFPDPEIFSEEEIKTLGYKIIDIKDEIIVDAVIANPDVEVEIYIGNKWFDLEDFFEVYDSNNKYLLKEYRKQMNDDMLKFIDKNKQDFNGGYIKASQEAYALFENPNCNGCSKNPFYINCFTPIKGQ